MEREKMSTYRTGEKLPAAKGNGLVLLIPDAVEGGFASAFAYRNHRLIQAEQVGDFLKTLLLACCERGQQRSGWNAAFATEPYAPLWILKSSGALLEERGCTFQKNDEARVGEIGAGCDDGVRRNLAICRSNYVHFFKFIFPVITSPDGVKIGEAVRQAVSCRSPITLRHPEEAAHRAHLPSSYPNLGECLGMPLCVNIQVTT